MLNLYASIDTFIVYNFINTSIFVNICLSITSNGSYSVCKFLQFNLGNILSYCK